MSALVKAREWAVYGGLARALCFWMIKPSPQVSICRRSDGYHHHQSDGPRETFTEASVAARALRALSMASTTVLALWYTAEIAQAQEDPSPPSIELSEQPDVKSNIHTVRWRVYTDRARIMFSEGSFAEAERLFYVALDEAKEGFGDDDPHVASCYNNLAELFRMRKDYEKAEPLYLEAIDRLKRSLGPEHGSVGFALHNLASFYLLQNKLEQAQQCYENALRVKRRALGLDHPEYASTMFHLGEVMRLRGNLNDALVLISDSVRILEDIGLGSSAIAVKRMNRLSELFVYSGKLVEAEALQRKVVQTLELSGDFSVMDVVNAMDSLSSILHRQGKLIECEGLLEKCIDILISTYGDANIRVAASLSKLGGIVFQRGKSVASADKVQALESYDKALGLLLKAVQVARLQWKNVNDHKTNWDTGKQKAIVELRTYPLVLIQSLIMVGVIRMHKLGLVYDDKALFQIENDAKQALEDALALLEDKQVKELLGSSLEAKKLHDDCSQHLAELMARKKVDLRDV